MSEKPATERQIAFIATLVKEREIDSIPTSTLDVARAEVMAREFTMVAARTLINALMTCPKIKTKTEAPVDPPEGMHRLGHVIYKVQRAIHGSGNLYAKRLTKYGDKWKFEYAPGGIHKLSADTKMTLEQAKKFGMLYGTCCVCGRTLTDENSIKAGIGPVCAGKF